MASIADRTRLDLGSAKNAMAIKSGYGGMNDPACHQHHRPVCRCRLRDDQISGAVSVEASYAAMEIGEMKTETTLGASDDPELLA